MDKRQKIFIGSLLGLIILSGLAYAYRNKAMPWLMRPTESTIQTSEVEEQAIETVASEITTPWTITFLPGDDMLVTERSGQIIRIGHLGKVYPISGVKETSEGGLLGLALHPKFSENNRLYIYQTSQQNNHLTNHVDEYQYRDDTLTLVRTIIANIPAANNHNGGAIAFGPDGKLYITTGDAAKQDRAQDKFSLAGKILRLNDDGSVPGDNPFGNYTWSYGHRNPQGIAWDDKGVMWSVEHGPSGGQSGRDELNRIERGVNYGWPAITGNEKADDMRSPIAQSGDNETWAPAGLVAHDGVLYFTGLRGQALYKATVKDDSAELTRYFSGLYGRLRAITIHNDKLFVGTSNRDGRGTPHELDDRILQIPLSRL